MDPTLSLFDVNDHDDDFNHHKRYKHSYDNYDNWWDIGDPFYFYGQHKQSTYYWFLHTVDSRQHCWHFDRRQFYPSNGHRDSRAQL